ncbi:MULTISPECIES: tripartite tricarboxylate transporter substrate binding protein [unclassified Beijerinckia]|uniref:Bug family tripartite tricarboxylate transporter substrate binding protein n=1 Tax=unclassified Beijerinckia TaxID=2638183 RepID=UPI00089774D5|nr:MULTISPECIES: tripartite tricarboxylate transporter substrate binding protein [unclassified Beijerinckia]MDH7795903.1 tripartite-type tricarboxylate transporter receptor subunit TctC [Beijerinckia sp. GAS462]SEC21451.1 Tripartite-type tricarboxylate transporter, receptor component TctC [Beijerinckia sp. 28-YEA-48]
MGGSTRWRAAAAVIIALASIATTPVHAQTYPTRPIKAVVSYTAGSGADILARYFTEELARLVGQPVIVENRPGAGGNIGGNAVAKAPPDGYTMFVTPSAPVTGNFVLYKEMPYRFEDFAPVTSLVNVPFTIVVKGDSPVKNMADLTTLIRSKQGKATYGAPTTSSIAITGMYLDEIQATGTPVPYKAAQEALRDVETGNVDFLILDLTGALGALNRGSVRAVAMLGDERFPTFPNVPTSREQGLKNVNWIAEFYALMPAGTPPDHVAKIEGLLNDILKRDETRAFLLKAGGMPYPGTSQILHERMLVTIEKWKRAAMIGKIPQL